MGRWIVCGLAMVSIVSGRVSAEEMPSAIDEVMAAVQETPDEEESPAFTVLGLEISGWTELSMTAGTAGGDHRPMGFNYQSNEFLLQQNWLRVDREFDGGTRLHSDWILPGADYNFTRAVGLFDDQDSRHGIDPVQFFLSRKFDGVGDGLELTLGRFFAPFGVESIAGPDNTLVSHSYSFIYNPFTQTGGLAQLAVNDNLTLRGGVVIGSDVFIHASNTPTFLAGMHWVDDDGLLSVDFLSITSHGRYDALHEIHNPQVFDLVVTREVSDSVTVTLEGLGGYEKDFPGVGTAYWYSGVGYVNWALEDDLDAAVRLELFNDEHGNRTGSAGLYTGLSVGLSYRWNEHLVVRPELRLDHNNESRPFDGDPMLFTATYDVIIRW
tara:strand:+ start:32 stop:1174 length:1143 start_codon:yes stop_codon:yes gene_type:complete